MSNEELTRVDPLVQNLLAAKELPALAHIDIEEYAAQADFWAYQIAERVEAYEGEFYKTPEDWGHCVAQVKREGGAFGQVAAAHEFGHLLGLKHPGTPEGKPDRNNIEEYLTDKGSVMAQGNDVRREAYFQKWADLMNKFYPKLGRCEVRRRGFFE